MVYRGKPSAGCEQCRLAKKRCTLEQPACVRCVKLRKPCSGYRDTTALQIQDETVAVTRKAEGRKAGHSTAVVRSRTTAPGATNTATQSWSQPLEASQTQWRVSQYSTPSSSEYIPDSFDPPVFSTDLPILDPTDEEDVYRPAPPDEAVSADFFSNLSTVTSWITRGFLPRADEVATSYFLSCFTSQGHWEYVPRYAAVPRMDPCLTLAIKACGMAALDNVRYVPQGRVWSRNVYGKALGMLNESLRDGEKCRTDESLIAVSVLSLYENLVCDSKQSVQSWKAHIQGATQLLKLRGKAQFMSGVGRNIFRETRAQIMIHCLWDDMLPPSFLLDWTPALQAASPDAAFQAPADNLIDICFDFATIQYLAKKSKITGPEALSRINEVDARMQSWATNTPSCHPHWSYTELRVDDSPHIWNNTVHSYAGIPMPGVWNTYRSIRIMVTRMQQMLAVRLRTPNIDHAAIRATRRRLADEICATIPCQLGHAPAPCWNSNAVLVTSYASIWPLFFAGTCALERLGLTTPNSHPDPGRASPASTALALTQLSWVLGRLDHISAHSGLHWADGVAATLRGDLRVNSSSLSPEDARLAPRNAFAGPKQSELVKQIEATGVGMVVEEEEEEGVLSGYKRVGWVTGADRPKGGLFFEAMRPDVRSVGVDVVWGGGLGRLGKRVEGE
ncbi:hypothetical protein LTR95_008641 [Oleoguttula sp. CCFEE 5521]